MRDNNTTNPELSSGFNPYRMLANGQTFIRLVMTPVIAHNIRTKAPEDRTIADGIFTTLTCATDFGDGLAADLADDNSVFGAEFDQIVDKIFVDSIDHALASTGEVASTHAYIKTARNIGMILLRAHAKINGNNIPVDGLGKQTTALSLANIVMANSPIAKHNGIIKGTMAHSTAASLISGINYTKSYFGGTGSKKDTDSARNGMFRSLSAKPVEGFVGYIANRFPDLTADQITEFGEKLVKLSGNLAEADPDNAAFATGIFTIGGLCDLIDGTFARYKGISDGSGTSAEGMITDVEADKRQEIAILINLSNIAIKRRNYVASTNYALAAMTRVLPSLFRADSESKGYICDEDGIGTRVGVAVLSGIGMAMNKNEDISNLVSSMILQGNINTTLQRRDVSQKGTDSPYCVGVNDDPEFKALGKIRAEALGPLAISGFTSGAQNLAKIYAINS